MSFISHVSHKILFCSVLFFSFHLSFRHFLEKKKIMSQYPSAANYLPSSPSGAPSTSYTNLGHPHDVSSSNNNTNRAATYPSPQTQQQGGYPGYPGISSTTTPTPTTTTVNNNNYFSSTTTTLNANQNFNTMNQYPGHSATTVSYPGVTNFNPIVTNPANNSSSYQTASTTNISNSSPYYNTSPSPATTMTTMTTSTATNYPTASSYLGIDTSSSINKNNNNQSKKNHSSSSSTPMLYTTPGGGTVNYPSAANYSSDTVYSMLGGNEPSSKNNHNTSSSSQQQQRPAPAPAPAVTSQKPPSRPTQSIHNPVHCPYNTAATYEQGRVRALMVGINFKGQDCELEGCVADVARQLKTLERLGFPIDECVILTDDPKFPRNGGMPTKKNLLYWMHWLVSDAQPGDTFFFHISSHGVSKRQPPDTPPEEREASGTDQFLVPLDHQTAGLIRDDDVFDILVRPLPPGSRLTCIFDLCNSGSVIDLPFEFRASRGDKDYYRTHDSASAFQRVNSKRHGGGDCVALSACADGTTAADVSNLGPVSKDDPFRGGGAMTYALSEVLTKTAGLSFGEVLMETREHLKRKKFSQVPQMSCTRPIDLTKPFSFFGSLEKVAVSSYQAPVWTPPAGRISTRSFAFPTLNQSEWVPPSSDYNVSNNMFPTANSVLQRSGKTINSVYSTLM